MLAISSSLCTHHHTPGTHFQAAADRRGASLLPLLSRASLAVLLTYAQRCVDRLTMGSAESGTATGTGTGAAIGSGSNTTGTTATGSSGLQSDSDDRFALTLTLSAILALMQQSPDAPDTLASLQIVSVQQQQQLQQLPQNQPASSSAPMPAPQLIVSLLLLSPELQPFAARLLHCLMQVRMRQRRQLRQFHNLFMYLIHKFDLSCVFLQQT
jgi:hypothetical protein